MDIRIKRVYEAPEAGDGLRCLVDRFWPRGIKKDSLPLDLWARDVSPSPALRTLLHQNPAQNWDRFREQYLAELAASEPFEQFAAEISRSHAQAVTLLFGFRDKERNHAQVLKEALEAKARQAWPKRMGHIL